MATNVTPKKKSEPVPEDGSMTLTGHLTELRNRFFVCLVVFVVAICAFLVISSDIVNLLTEQGRNAGFEFITVAMSEKLIQYFSISIKAGIVVVVPVAMYEVYAFAKPGLKKTERFFFGLTMFGGLCLFVIGVLFAYFIAYPNMVNFFVGIEGTDYIINQVTLENYINFTLLVYIIFGCVFEIPLVAIILSKMGIVSPDLMKKGRGIAIVIIFVIAAIITPPDVVSQCMVALPMVVLYEFSILLSRIFYKPRLEGDDDDDEDEDDEDDDD